MLNFDVRHPNFGIFKSSDYQHGQQVADYEISDASNVILHYQSRGVIVVDVKPLDSGGYSGTVSAIEPPGSKLQGVREGYRVVFQQQHVFSMATKTL
jgi:hypothetical protein